MSRLSDVYLNRRLGWRYCAALILAFVCLASPREADAHAFLERSEPAANAVMAVVPAEVRIWFTEPLEPAYTSAELFDVRGDPVSTPQAVIDAGDRHQLILPLPDDLAPGTYTVSWRNISAADGHPAEGFFAFTIGTAEDVAVPATPEATSFGGLPIEVEVTNRWMVLLGLMLPLGMLMTLFLVLPAAAGTQEEGVELWSALRAAMLGSLLAAVAGSVVLLVDQTETVAASFSISAAQDLLGDSSFGRYWLLRGGAILLFAGALVATPRLEGAGSLRRYLLVALAALPLIPLSLSSHAAAIGTGDGAAIVADVLHLAAGSVWVGGLLALLVFLLLAAGEFESRGRALLVVVPRFSTLAIASVLVLVASGLYATWLQVGNLDALRETDYGQTLLVKLLLMLAMLCLGAANLLILEPRLRAGRATGSDLRHTVTAEVSLGVVLLLVVGLLTSLPTARGSVESETGRIARSFDAAGTGAALVIAPGAVGANRYTVDIHTDDHAASEGTLFLRFSHAGGDLAGLQEVELPSAGQHRYEGAGSELSVPGEWDIEILFRQPDTPDWRATARIEVGAVPSTGSIPGAAARFPGIVGALAVPAVLLAIPLLVVGLRRPASRRLLATGIALLVLGIAGLLLTGVMPDDARPAPDATEHQHTRSTPSENSTSPRT